MAHVELSLSEAFVPQSRTATDSGGFRRWIDTVRSAAEPCLVIDVDTTIRAVSTSCCTLLGFGAPAEALGRHLLDGVLRLVDFTAARCELTEAEIDKIPPLLALTSGCLARGLLRVQTDPTGSADATVDAIATPLLVNGKSAGSLTFFAAV